MIINEFEESRTGEKNMEEKQIQIDYPVPELNVDDEPETYRIEVSAAGSGDRRRRAGCAPGLCPGK